MRYYAKIDGTDGKTRFYADSCEHRCYPSVSFLATALREDSEDIDARFVNGPDPKLVKFEEAYELMGTGLHDKFRDLTNQEEKELIGILENRLNRNLLRAVFV